MDTAAVCLFGWLVGSWTPELVFLLLYVAFAPLAFFQHTALHYNNVQHADLGDCHRLPRRCHAVVVLTVCACV